MGSAGRRLHRRHTRHPVAISFAGYTTSRRLTCSKRGQRPLRGVLRWHPHCGVGLAPAFTHVVPVGSHLCGRGSATSNVGTPTHTVRNSLRRSGLPHHAACRPAAVRLSIPGHVQAVGNHPRLAVSYVSVRCSHRPRSSKNLCRYCPAGLGIPSSRSCFAVRLTCKGDTRA